MREAKVPRWENWVWSAVEYGSFAAIVYGCFLWSRPAGFISLGIVGLFLFAEKVLRVALREVSKTESQ